MTRPNVLAAPPKSKAGRKKRKTSSAYPIIVHCHLCWDWVWQRPQQFLSRFSEHPVLYVETLGPSPDLKEARVSVRNVLPNVTVLQIQFPLSQWHDGHFIDLERRRLVQETVRGPLAGKFDAPIQWFYDPMAVTAFAGHMDERLTVYDCMDELSQFRGASPEIARRERMLLSVADVVFTGGRKLWESKKRFNSNCYFHGCGVDVKHFGSARTGKLARPADLQNIAGPMLGYFGVVDERLDYELLDAMSKAHPDWQIVMVGPTIKVNPNSLPKARNIHWLGSKPYAELPAYAAAFDVCLMPFALNEATEYINPTKALEYMATGRPIVSSAVPDVVANFSEVVEVAESPRDFIARCESCLKKRNETRVQRGLEMAADNTWESIVGQLKGHIEQALTRKAGATFSHAEYVDLHPKGGRINLPLPSIY